MRQVIPLSELDLKALRALDPAAVNGLSELQREAVGEAIIAAWQLSDPSFGIDVPCESAVYFKVSAAHR